ncbi:hypothetical protein [Brevibacillus agri]|uniref:hypothetical protein n=1 Tax=Brevibacillus agri TaxID=51101 RepID=UPI0030F391FA
MAFGSPQGTSDALLAHLADSGNIKKEFCLLEKYSSWQWGCIKREKGGWNCAGFWRCRFGMEHNAGPIDRFPPGAAVLRVCDLCDSENAQFHENKNTA